MEMDRDMPIPSTSTLSAQPITTETAFLQSEHTLANPQRTCNLLIIV